MRLSVELPNWATKTGIIRIFAGYELVAVLEKKIDGWYLKVKTSRCKVKLGYRCGLCCILEGCSKLKNGICNSEKGIPFRCLASTPKGVKECTEKFEECIYV